MEKFFKLKENGTTVTTEILAGLTIFLSMAYILFVNPSILVTAMAPGAGPETSVYAQYFGALMVATIFGAATATLVMGLYANYPFALAPGMGLNAYFTYTVVLKMGIPWQIALGAIFVEGIIFIILTASGARTFVVRVIPQNIKFATSAGIGLFIAFIGLKSANIIVSNPATFVGLGDLTKPDSLLAIIGLILTAVLFALRVPGSILLGLF
nr:NCS2 family permease [Marinitoga lauensis]